MNGNTANHKEMKEMRKVCSPIVPRSLISQELHRRNVHSIDYTIPQTIEISYCVAVHTSIGVLLTSLKESMQARPSVPDSDGGS